eukprot:jgi/Botrbrau1/14769/Bobra.0284s0003.1
MPVAGGSPDQDRDACKAEACKIQDCLAKNNYDVSRCQGVIKELQKCCERYQGVSIHCGFSEPGKKDSVGAAPNDQIFKGR